MFDPKKILDKLTGGVKWPFQKIDREFSEGLAEKTAVTVAAGFDQLEIEAPMAVKLLRGEPVYVRVQLTDKPE